MMKKVAADAVKGHEKKMHGMAKGGVTRADGCVMKGHTKGKNGQNDGRRVLLNAN
jgi:hypothetical protein